MYMHIYILEGIFVFLTKVPPAQAATKEIPVAVFNVSSTGALTQTGTFILPPDAETVVEPTTHTHSATDVSHFEVSVIISLCFALKVALSITQL